MSTPRDFCKQMQKMHSLNRKESWYGPYDLVLEHGFQYRDAPGQLVGVEKGELKSCFLNAYRLMMKDTSLTYVEGYANAGMIPVHHAWCVNEDGDVIDNTWGFHVTRGDDEEWEYFGVPFDRNYIMALALKTEHPGVFFPTDFLNKDIPEKKFVVAT